MNRHEPPRTAMAVTVAESHPNSLAFTLLELLVAIAIAAILAGMLLPATLRAYRGAVARSTWTYVWSQARMKSIAWELPDQESYLWTTTPEQAFRETWPGMRWCDVPKSQVAQWREFGERNAR